MGRLPFDASKMGGPDPPPPPRSSQKDRPLSVSGVAEMIDGALKDALPARIRMIGEISGFTNRTHWYFSVKDAESVISCVMFASAARSAGFIPENGQEVIVSGRIQFFNRQGRTQFYVSRIEPVGAGELELRFRALCEELRGLGWFAPESKTPLPTFPRRIAVVTSKTGAALQDVLDTARRRCTSVEIIVVDARVQGDVAAAEIASAIRWLGEHRERLQIDAIIVTRGGGSMEDLWAFNERVVAEAIHACPLAIVAAIGHETDTTIAELVADERCATPTQAAMRLIPDAAALLDQVEATERRLRSDLRRVVEVARHRLLASSRFPLFASPQTWVRDASERAGRLEQRLAAAARSRADRAHLRLERTQSRFSHVRPEAVIERRRGRIESRTAELRTAIRHMVSRRMDRLESVDRALRSVGPTQVLRRGYSVTTDASGRIVSSMQDVRPGDQLETRVADGSIRSTVQGEDASPSPPPSPAKAPRSKRRAADDGKDQMGLF